MTITMRQNIIVCPKVGKRYLERHDESRVVLVDKSLMVRFTPTEYRLLVPLLNDGIVADKELAKTALEYTPQDASQLDKWIRNTLDKHVDNLRSKLRPVGLDIYRVLRYNGYLLGESMDHEEFAV